MSRTFLKFFLIFLFFQAGSFCFSENSPEVSESAPKEELNEDLAESPQSESSPERSKLSLPANAILFFRDLLNDKYPFRIDFGAEPHRHGSMVFGSVDYDWSDSFSQRFRIEYDHYMTSTNSSGSLANQEVRSFTIMPFPVVFFFGDSDIRSKGRFTQFNFGLYLSYSVTGTDAGTFFSAPNNEQNRATLGLADDFSNPTIIGFMTSNTEQKYTILGPSFGYSVNIPLTKYISAMLEGFIVPAYIVYLTTEAEGVYHINDGASRYLSNSVDYRSLSYPLARQTVALDFFRYVRIKAHMTYQHLDLRTVTFSSSDVENYSLHTITLRYGGEIIKPAKTRKKSSHLWAGLYYEMTWNKSYIQDVYNSEYNGKWLLCFGT